MRKRQRPDDDADIWKLAGVAETTLGEQAAAYSVEQARIAHASQDLTTEEHWVEAGERLSELHEINKPLKLDLREGAKTSKRVR